MKKKRIIKISIAVIFLAGIVVGSGILSYSFAESIVKYKYKSTTAVSPQNHDVTDIYIPISPEEIPESKEYTLKLEDGTICVYDQNKSLIYREKINDFSPFSAKDRNALEQDGIKYTVRSELVEILNYIRT